MMKTTTLACIGLFAMLGLSACQKPEVQQPVSPVNKVAAPTPAKSPNLVSAVPGSDAQPKAATYDPNLKPAPIVYDKKPN